MQSSQPEAPRPEDFGLTEQQVNALLQEQEKIFTNSLIVAGIIVGGLLLIPFLEHGIFVALSGGFLIGIFVGLPVWVALAVVIHEIGKRLAPNAQNLKNYLAVQKSYLEDQVAYGAKQRQRQIVSETHQRQVQAAYEAQQRQEQERQRRAQAQERDNMLRAQAIENHQAEMAKQHQMPLISETQQRQAAYEAQQLQQKSQAQFWQNLDGRQFEREIAQLFRQHGYHTTLTPVSGDEGIDILLYKDGKKIVVQCKAHRDPVGPSVIRELYGSMFHAGAQEAKLVACGGFTQGVYAFARGKPIELLDLRAILHLQQLVQPQLLQQPTQPLQRPTQPQPRQVGVFAPMTWRDLRYLPLLWVPCLVLLLLAWLLRL